MLAKRILQSVPPAALWVSLSLPLPSQIPAAQSGEARPAIVIDGQTGDWTEPKFLLDSKSGAEIAFQNDGRYLYILFAVKKPETRDSLESTGLTVLTPAGRTKASRGVLFLRRRVSADTYIRWQESQGELLTEGEKAKIRETAQYNLCFAFGVGAGGSTYGPLLRLRESEPPEFGVSESAAETIYELKIPLQPPDVVPGGLGTPAGENIRLSFEWGGKARKVFSTKTTRGTTPLEKMADVAPSGVTWAQEFLDTYDSLSRPTTGTKKFSFAVEVKLAGANK
jgi:hypothetical protein